MQLVCPACGCAAPAEVYLADAAAREAIVRALHLPRPLASSILAYLRLFSPPQRALRWTRLEALLTDLLAAIEAAQVRRHGRTWPAPTEYWAEALAIVVENSGKLTLPLKTHGYLLSVVAGIAERGEARAEAHRESQRQYGHHVERGGAAGAPIAEVVTHAAVRSSMPPEVREHLQSLLAKKPPKPDEPTA